MALLCAIWIWLGPPRTLQRADMCERYRDTDPIQSAGNKETDKMKLVSGGKREDVV